MQTCDSCNDLRGMIDRAKMNADWKKARVLQSVLDRHIAEVHRERVIAGPDNALWPGKVVEVQE